MRRLMTGRGIKVKKHDIVGWLIMLPSLVLFAFYIWEPLFENIRLSLHKSVRYEVLDFVGLDNYRRVLANPDFAAAFRNTFSYTLWN